MNKSFLFFLVFTIFFSSVLLTVSFAQIVGDLPSLDCFCRVSCQSMVPPEIMDCRFFTYPPPASHPYRCPGLCKPNVTTTTIIVCPMDAKLCPDGTYVGRVPPSCEFAPCPTPCSEVGGICLPYCPPGYTAIKNASCGGRVATCCLRTSPPEPQRPPQGPIVCPMPFGQPVILPPGQVCPPIEWKLPLRIALYGFAILQDFSDFRTVELGVSYLYTVAPAPTTGWLWVDNVKYSLRNVVLNQTTRQLTADVYNNTDLIGTISLTFSQKIYPRPREPRVINYRDVAYGDLLFNNVNHKVYLIGRLLDFWLPYPMPR